MRENSQLESKRMNSYVGIFFPRGFKVYRKAPLSAIKASLDPEHHNTVPPHQKNTKKRGCNVAILFPPQHYKK